ncbi:MAG: hypothetical protein J0I45_08005 [Bosea sp.]|nr:hypothetical protein [Bosea sp. (in: a-proteobacteria)]
MDLYSAYEAEYRLIESWLDTVFPQACIDAGLPLAQSAPPAHVSDIARDERWFSAGRGDAVPALLQVYCNTNRCNVVILMPAETPEDHLADKIAATTVGAAKLGWTFHTVDPRCVVCFFDGIDLSAPSGLNSGWIARDTARMLRWLLSMATTF